MIKSTPLLSPLFQVYRKVLKEGMKVTIVRREDGYSLRFGHATGYDTGFYQGDWGGIFELHLAGLNSINRIYRHEV